MKRVNYASRVKRIRTIAWICGYTILFACYAFSWTLIV